MASLSIGLDAGGTAAGGSAPGMVAELDRIDGIRGDGERQHVSVSAREDRVVSGLTPGLWEVRIVTPAGRVLSQEVDLAEGASEPVRFDLREPTATSVAKSGGGVRRNVAPSSSEGRLGRVNTFGLDPARSVPSGPRAGSSGLTTRVFASAADVRLEARTVAARTLNDPVEIVAQWRRIADALDEGLLPDELWSAGQVAQPIGSLRRPDGGRSWDFAGARGDRTFVSLDRGAVRRLRLMPVPWHTNAQASVRLETRAGGPEAGRLTVADDAFAGLLAYLSHGAVVTAVVLLGADRTLDGFQRADAFELLRDKRASPMGACAAAYALIGSSPSGVEAPWHSWVGNLRRWFEWLPDGAILDARLALLMSRTEGNVAVALPMVQEALGRGVPFYRQGLDWLQQAMLQFPDDALVSETRPLVSRVAAALDLSELFTTFTLDPAP